MWLLLFFKKQAYENSSFPFLPVADNVFFGAGFGVPRSVRGKAD